MDTKKLKLLTLLLTLENKLLRVIAELNMSHLKRKLLNMLINLELKESPKPEKSKNLKKKSDMKKYQEKSLSLTIMLLNILDNISHNISQKNKLNMLLEKEK